MTNKKTMVISILTIITLLITGILSMGRASVSAYTMTEASGQAESKIYSEATVDDDFAENSMLVILSEQAILSFKVYTKDDFPELNCYDVVDLTWQTSEMVKKQLAAEKSGNWRELQAWKDNSMLVDIPNFRRILSLRINSPSSSDALESRNVAERSSAEIRSNKESVLSARK